MRVIFPKVTCFKHLYPYVYREFVAYIKRVPFEHNEWVVVMPFHFLNCILELAHIMVWFLCSDGYSKESSDSGSES